MIHFSMWHVIYILLIPSLHNGLISEVAQLETIGSLVLSLLNIRVLGTTLKVFLLENKTVNALYLDIQTYGQDQIYTRDIGITFADGATNSPGSLV